MGTFEDYKTAFQMRDTVNKLVMNVVEQERPKPRYATVVSWDRDARICMVQYPEGGDPMPVQMGSVQPTYVGQNVRIEGPMGDKVLTDVFGKAHYESWGPDQSGEARERLWLILGGATANSNWTSSVSQYDLCFFGGYDISGNVDGAWKEERQFMRRGEYVSVAYYLKGSNIGRFHLSLDGTIISGTVDGYQATYAGGSMYMGNFSIAEDGYHTLRITVAGKNASASAFFCAFTCLQVWKVGLV